MHRRKVCAVGFGALGDLTCLLCHDIRRIAWKAQNFPSCRSKIELNYLGQWNSRARQRVILTLFIRVVKWRNTFENFRGIAIFMDFHSVRKRRQKERNWRLENGNKNFSRFVKRRNWVSVWFYDFWRRQRKHKNKLSHDLQVNLLRDTSFNLIKVQFSSTSRFAIQSRSTKNKHKKKKICKRSTEKIDRKTKLSQRMAIWCLIKVDKGFEWIKKEFLKLKVHFSD